MKHCLDNRICTQTLSFWISIQAKHFWKHFITSGSIRIIVITLFPLTSLTVCCCGFGNTLIAFSLWFPSGEVAALSHWPTAISGMPRTWSSSEVPGSSATSYNWLVLRAFQIPVPPESDFLPFVQLCNSTLFNFGFIINIAFNKAGKQTSSRTQPLLMKWLRSSWSSSLSSMTANAGPQYVYSNAFYLAFPSSIYLLPPIL